MNPYAGGGMMQTQYVGMSGPRMMFPPSNTPGQASYYQGGTQPQHQQTHTAGTPSGYASQASSQNNYSAGRPDSYGASSGYQSSSAGSYQSPEPTATKPSQSSGSLSQNPYQQSDDPYSQYDYNQSSGYNSQQDYSSSLGSYSQQDYKSPEPYSPQDYKPFSQQADNTSQQSYQQQWQQPKSSFPITDPKQAQLRGANQDYKRDDQKPFAKPGGNRWSANVDPGLDELELDESLVVLDQFNSDLNLVIDKDGNGGTVLTDPPGFCFTWAGARATYGVCRGKVFYEVHIVEYLPTDFGEDHQEVDPNVVRLGWSIDNSSFQLGEEPWSFGFGGTGKFSTNNRFTDYGTRFEQGDVIGAMLDLDSRPATISFMKNGTWLGVAAPLHGFPVGSKDMALFPHILSKNCRFKVNFGQLDAWFPPPMGFRYIGHLPLADRVRGMVPPPRKSDCEMIMIVGLPGSGKTTWGLKMQKNYPEKRYNIIGTDTLIEKMRVMGLPRKRNYHGRWDVLIDKATKCLNKMFDLAAKRRRNYILDQTNVYASARRRKMKNFFGFYRIAAVLQPEDPELERRSKKRTIEDGKVVPESAVLEMKANYSIPEERDDNFDRVDFVELKRDVVNNLVVRYNDEGKSQPKLGNQQSQNRFDSQRPPNRFDNQPNRFDSQPPSNRFDSQPPPNRFDGQPPPNRFDNQQNRFDRSRPQGDQQRYDSYGSEGFSRPGYYDRDSSLGKREQRFPDQEDVPAKQFKPDPDSAALDRNKRQFPEDERQGSQQWSGWSEPAWSDPKIKEEPGLSSSQRATGYPPREAYPPSQGYSEPSGYSNSDSFSKTDSFTKSGHYENRFASDGQRPPPLEQGGSTVRGGVSGQSFYRSQPRSYDNLPGKDASRQDWQQASDPNLAARGAPAGPRSQPQGQESSSWQARQASNFNQPDVRPWEANKSAGSWRQDVPSQHRDDREEGRSAAFSQQDVGDRARDRGRDDGGRASERYRGRESDRDRGRDADRDRDLARDSDRSRGRDRDRSRDRDNRSYNRDNDRSRSRGNDRDNYGRDSNRDRDYSRDGDRSRDRNNDRSRDSDRNRGRDIDKERDERNLGVGIDKEKNRPQAADTDTKNRPRDKISAAGDSGAPPSLLSLNTTITPAAASDVGKTERQLRRKSKWDQPGDTTTIPVDQIKQEPKADSFKSAPVPGNKSLSGQPVTPAPVGLQPQNNRLAPTVPTAKPAQDINKEFPSQSETTGTPEIKLPVVSNKGDSLLGGGPPAAQRATGFVGAGIRNPKVDKFDEVKEPVRGSVAGGNPPFVGRDVGMRNPYPRGEDAFGGPRRLPPGAAGYKEDPVLERFDDPRGEAIYDEFEAPFPDRPLRRGPPPSLMDEELDMGPPIRSRPLLDRYPDLPEDLPYPDLGPRSMASRMSGDGLGHPRGLLFRPPRLPRMRVPGFNGPGPWPRAPRPMFEGGPRGRWPRPQF